MSGHERELAEEEPAEVAPTARSAVTYEPTVARVLALQRSAGNAAVGRLLRRRWSDSDDPQHTVTGRPYESWSQDEVRAIQRQLKRLRFYRLGIDGDLGPGTDRGLVEAFGGDSWRDMSSEVALESLRAAERAAPEGGGAHSLRYGELFKDGVFDVTLGIGFIETDPSMQSTQAQIADRAVAALEADGFSEDQDGALAILQRAGRSIDVDDPYGRFFVRDQAFTYEPVAGQPQEVDVVVRLVYNEDPADGSQALQAFRQGMVEGDFTYYVGHGRYGTGPDFDRNYIEFRLYDHDGNLEQTITDYTVLEQVLRADGDPWTRFQTRLADGTLEADLSNAGNLLINPHTAHSGEFGGRLMEWALAQGGADLQTGPQGALGRDADDRPDRKYRVVAFYGCRTSDYDRALRQTDGFDAAGADLLETNRTVRPGAEVEAFLALLNGMVVQSSAESLLRDTNRQMRAHEAGYTTNPFAWTGLGDNPGA